MLGRRELLGHPRNDGRVVGCPDDLCRTAYVDHFGDAITGLRAAILRATG
jgi:hypothetical protein